MLDYLLAADLLVLTVCQALLVWHCFKAGPKAALFAGYLTERVEHLSDSLTEYGAILEDIADALDGSGAGPSMPAGAGAGVSIPELLTTALMNRMAMALPDGTNQENPLRAIHEAIQTAGEQDGPEPDEHA